MRVFRQFPLYLIGRLVPAVIAFGGIALYTRLLDPFSFGTYALLLSTSYLVSLVGYSWLRVATLRMMASVSATEEPDYIATIAMSFAGASVVVTGVLLLVLRVANPKLAWPLYVLTAAVAVLVNWFELNVAMVIARMRLISHGVLQTARAVGALAATLALIAAGYTVEALLGGFALGNCVAFGAIALWRPATRGRFRRAIFMRLFRFGWPSSASSFSYCVNTSQRYLLQLAGGSAVVGIFAAAVEFSDKTIGLLVGTANLAGQPLAYRARDLGAGDQLAAQLRNNARLIFAVALGSAVAVIALSDSITHVYFGERFRVGAQWIIVLSAVSALLAGLRASYFEQAFEISLATRPLAVLAVLRIALILVPSIVLVPRFGALGAVGSAVIGETISLAVTIAWARRLIAMPVPLRSFAVTVVAAAAMVGAVDLVPQRETPLGLLAALVAAGLTFGAVHVALYAHRARAIVRIPWRIAEAMTRT